MKWIITALLATAVTANAAFWDKDEDGNMKGINDLTKKAADATAAYSNELNQASATVKAESEKLVEKTKEAMAKYNVKAEEIKADFAKSSDELKAKIADFKTEQLLAYAEKCKALYAEKKVQVDEYAQKLKELGWKDKLTAKGKELKTKLGEYSDEMEKLKAQFSIYAEKLKAMGVNLSDYGLGADTEEPETPPEEEAKTAQPESKE